ncbi:hypothetical protein LCGC14_0420970 [marine sediment metagenome]|uniref:Uncharacterized protein n=1 Tax=marine sediment metagenome TaxID=412755 RepID=A0A0F9SQR7_9ZZZZ
MLKIYNSPQRNYDIGYKDGYNYVKSIKELQGQVGAVPDGVWGVESKEKHRLAVCQQSADKWINAKSMGIKKQR